jgi:cytidine deaminase
MINPRLLKIIQKKALDSNCRYKIAALGFNKRMELVCKSFNKKRFYRKGGGIHAEMAVMKSSKSIRTIIICRINQSGNFLPIEPCSICREKARELGIKILTVTQTKGE